MAKAHSLLSQSRWEGVSIEKLLLEELKPYAGGNSSVVLNGTDVHLTQKSALALSLAVHELATNAAKFGSLSRPGGRVTVSWSFADEGGIELSWNETGGPPVDVPTRRGFGSTLIERALAMETGGRVKMHYLRSGVVCEIFLPFSSASRAVGVTPKTGSPVPIVVNLDGEADDEAFRILIVEDSFLLLADLETVFEILGWKVAGTASRKSEALEILQAQTFDAALLDVNLDGEMSWDVAAKLTELAIPFVFSTGYDVSKMLPRQFADSPILGKPYNINELESSIRKAIGTAREMRRNAIPVLPN
jgi:CheY-like chemotaxis protein